jgi:hypothetical protein
MRIFSGHPNATGGENGVSPDRREALRLRLRLYCDRHIEAIDPEGPESLDRRFTAFFTAAQLAGFIDAGRCPQTLAHLFIAVLANLDLRRNGGAPAHELRRTATAAIRLIVD